MGGKELCSSDIISVSLVPLRTEEPPEGDRQHDYLELVNLHLPSPE